MSLHSDPYEGSRLAELRRGAALPLRGLRMLRERRELWPLALLPGGLTALAVFAAGFTLFTNAGELTAWIGALLPQIDAGPWYSWLWIGPGKLLLWIAHGLLFAVAAAAALVAALLCASLIASPLLDGLSARVERCAAGTCAGDERDGLNALLRDALAAILSEAGRVAFFGSVWIGIWLVGLIVPGGALLAAPALVAVTVLFLPLEYAAYALDRRRVSFAARRAWLAEHRSFTTGFGAAAFALGLVPGLNLLLLPVLVTAGTLLVLELPPPLSDAAGDGGGAGDPTRAGSGDRTGEVDERDDRDPEPRPPKRIG